MEKPHHAARQSWWSRQSGARKLFYIAVPIVLIIALAIGLGVGLTRGGPDDGEEPDTTPSPTPTSPPRNGTIWQPAVNETWQIVLLKPLELAEDTTSIEPDVSVYDIDLFTNEVGVIETLHRLGKRVICYFSAGSYEDYRPDSGQFQQSDRGRELDGWPGEYWLNVNSDNVRNIMVERMRLASQKGCDAVDPDNVDGYVRQPFECATVKAMETETCGQSNENGLGLTQQDAINYVNFLSEEATRLNMSIGLKNAAEIIPQVINVTHFSVNEQCVEYSECDTFAAFVQDGKPVFHIEYPSSAPSIQANVVSNICSGDGDAEGAERFSTVLKNMNLDGWVEYCNGETFTTETEA
ncbi:hypothetical protein H2201_001414 [Coniosporium apollinis]|uniref:alpha-galactosidase n=2 Tax=Coniosporium TaxID=2810619 RepID=A0ABQ9P307_9PEZI|nr:hypothetical protein H2199_002504 [Cladosporium sp. JES 115]KAJ9668366.1 hypothetical protein H2201_001414 [Coniosporium apollinis]